MNANDKEITAVSRRGRTQPGYSRGRQALITFYFLLSTLCFFKEVRAQTFTTLKSFGFLTNVTGFYPHSTLVRGPDGTLYGTATSGEGSVFGGTVFKMQPDGSGFTPLKLFTNYLEGFSPNAGVTLSGTVLYGTTYNGGGSGQGTVFSLNTDGTGFTVLKNFSGSDGANPNLAALTVSGSVLYGTTYSGGASGNGTVFALNTDDRLPGAEGLRRQ